MKLLFKADYLGYKQVGALYLGRNWHLDLDWLETLFGWRGKALYHKIHQWQTQ